MTGLVDLPKGDASKQCEYTVTFPPSHIAGSVRYRRTGPATATLKNGTTASSAYEVLEAVGALDLRNITASSGVHTGMTSRSGVRVSVHPVAPIPGTSPIQACIDVAPHGEYDSSDATTYAALPAGATDTPTPVAAASTQLTLGTGDPACQFEVEFVNADEDCKVFAQLKDEAGMNIGSAQLANTAGNITLFTKSTDQFKVFYHDGTNEHTVGSIDFSVPDPSDGSASPAGVCTTFFDATDTIRISVSDVIGSANHRDTMFEVSAARVGSATVCPESASATLSLSYAAPGAHEATGNFSPALVNSHYQGTACSYTLTFPAMRPSAGSPGITLKRLRTVPSSAVLSASDIRVTGEYEAVRPARVPLVNVTSPTADYSLGSPATRSTVDVAVVPAASCTTESTPANNTHEVVASATQATRTETGIFGERECEWKVNFANDDAQCPVTAQLKKLDDSDPANPQVVDITGASATTNSTVTAGVYTNTNTTPAGSISVWVDSDRRIRSAVSGGGDLVHRIEFTVDAPAMCTSKFVSGDNLMVSLNITDTVDVALSGNIEITLTSERAECTASQDVQVPLNKKASRAGEAFPGGGDRAGERPR